MKIHNDYPRKTQLATVTHELGLYEQWLAARVKFEQIAAMVLGNGVKKYVTRKRRAKNGDPALIAKLQEACFSEGQKAVSKGTGISRSNLSLIVNQRQGLSPTTRSSLGKYFNDDPL